MILMQEQRNYFTSNPREYNFEELKVSSLCNMEKSKIFYEIKTALNILYKFTKFESQTGNEELTPFVLECLKNFSPPTKFSVKENMMN